jgi:putative ABC transport system permease protein
MSAGPVLRAASGGVTRRLMLTTVIFLVLLASAAAATLGLTLLTNANAAFQNGFAAHRGADVAVSIGSGRVRSAQLAATRRLPQVTRAAGPYPVATVTLATAGTSGWSPGGGPQARSSGNGRTAGPSPGSDGAVGGSSGSSAAGHSSVSGGAAGPPLTVIGRASPGGPLDDLTLNGGHWAAGPGEIVLAVYRGFLPPLGSKVTVTSAPGKPQLTVVGYAGSPGRFGDAWVAPGEIAALRPKGAPADVQMLYTFTHAATARQIGADVAALKAALPAGAVTGYQSWLGSANQTSAEQSINTPFVVAFALIGLVLAMLIVANVVSGAVVAGYRRIGVLKSIGFTPSQVAAAYIAQIGMPALAGCVAGTALGNLWVTPMLNVSAGLFKVGAQHVPLWINMAVPLGMCALGGLAALVPALRAGRLSAVQAIAAGQAPRAGHGYAAHRLAGRLALPRPVTIGLAAPFTRPARTAATLAAIMSGATAVILAVGLDSSLAKMNEISDAGQGQVQVDPAGHQPTFTFRSRQEQAIAAALRAQPGTLRHVAQAITGSGLNGAHPKVSVSGLPLLAVYAYEGDSAWLGYQMVSGRWYNGPGEVDVNTAFLTQTGLKVGGNVALTVNGKPVTARIAGQVFVPNEPYVFTSWQTLGGTAAGLTAAQYDIGLKPGISPHAYVTALTRKLGRGFSVSVPQGGGGISSLADTSLIRLLTVVIAVLAGLGVLNSVLMVTRERVHDLGVFKAVGMTPRQTIAMVTCWVVAPAIAAALIALPAAIIAHSVTLRAIGSEAGTGIPASVVAIYRPAELLLLAASGLAIAAIGALGPASWAAATRTVTALRAE